MSFTDEHTEAWNSKYFDQSHILIGTEVESERRSQSSPIELTWLTIVLNLTQNWEDYEKSSLDDRIENLKTQIMLFHHA